MPSANDLRKGMVVEVEGTYDDEEGIGYADMIKYDKELEGPISSISFDPTEPMIKELEVMGKRVIVKKNETKFEDTSFDDLAEGMFIEVSGYKDSSDAIHATYVEKESDAYDPVDDEVEIEGFVTELDMDNETFVIDSYTVYYSKAEFDDFSPSELENGLFVEVEGKLEEPDKIYETEIEREDDYDDD